MTLTRRLACLAVLGTALAQPAFAQAPVERLRGDIASVSGDAVVVHTREGTDVTVALAGDTVFRSVVPATLADIKPGAMIGIVSRGPADRAVAVAIQIFIPGAPVRQGQSNWDMLPESTMTNAVVEGQATATADGALDVKAGDKAVHMTISPDVIVGAAGAADKSVLVAGAKVVVFAAHEGTTYTARNVIVGKDGMTPPL